LSSVGNECSVSSSLTCSRGRSTTYCPSTRSSHGATVPSNIATLEEVRAGTCRASTVLDVPPPRPRRVRAASLSRRPRSRLRWAPFNWVRRDSEPRLAHSPCLDLQRRGGAATARLRCAGRETRFSPTFFSVAAGRQAEGARAAPVHVTTTQLATSRGEASFVSILRFRFFGFDTRLPANRWRALRPLDCRTAGQCRSAG
jgi:hypothetical protein